MKKILTSAYIQVIDTEVTLQKFIYKHKEIRKRRDSCN